MASVGVMHVGTTYEQINTENKDDNLENSSESEELQRAIAMSLEVNQNQEMSVENNGDVANDIKPKTRENTTSAPVVSIQVVNDDNKELIDETRTTQGTSNNRILTMFHHIPTLKMYDKEWPKGLCNLGNTCWFNAVIQPLFHLPCIRNILLAFKITESSDESTIFVKHLRELFSLMTCSNQPHLSPNMCLSALQNVFQNTKTQQDATEFSHKLLDLLENALKAEENDFDKFIPINSASDEDTANKTNPIVNLFYGDYVSISSNSEEKKQTFGPLPLCVNGMVNLHDSIEYTLTQENSKVLIKDDQAPNSTEEIWFIRLPPVLMFELSRFNFNKVFNRTEKLHNKLHFPMVIYMDRYMQNNMDMIKKLREKCKNLHAVIKDLREQLATLSTVTIENKTISITSMLDECCKFVNKQKEKHETSMTSILEQGRDIEMMEADDSMSTTEHKEATFVENHLSKLAEELISKTNEINTAIIAAETELDVMYEDILLKKHQYTLHAVVVHQGQALAGHYWSYIYNHAKQQWIKYNDESVTLSSFDEVLNDSVGGMCNSFELPKSTAYSLMYVDSTRLDLRKDDPNAIAIELISRDSELSTFVSNHIAGVQTLTKQTEAEKPLEIIMQDQPNDNQLLDVSAYSRNDQTQPKVKETGSSQRTWQYKANEEAMLKVKSRNNHHVDPEKALEEDSKAPENLLIFGIDDYVEDDFAPSFQSAMLAMVDLQTLLNEKGEEGVLLQIVKNEWQRLSKISEKPINLSEDPRLQHIAVFMFKNNVPRKVIERAILEQFSDSRLSYDTDTARIVQCAKRKMRDLAPSEQDSEVYELWLRLYTLYCKATCSLVKSIELFMHNYNEEAVPYLINVLKLNCRILRKFNSDAESSAFLIASRQQTMLVLRECIKSIHTNAVSECNSGNAEQVDHALNNLANIISPCVHILEDTLHGGGSEADNCAIEDIRQAWCAIWASENDALDIERIKLAVQQLMETPTDSLTDGNFKTPPSIQPSSLSLCQRYTAAMKAFQ